MRHNEVGYVAISRKLLNSSIMDKPPIYFKWWVWMICRANHKEVENRGVIFHRGELLTDYEEMMEVGKHYVGWSKKRPTKSNVEGCLNWLRKERMITTRKTTRGLYITIEKYEYFQNPASYERYKENDVSATVATHTGDVINKNDNNGDNDKEHSSGKSPELSGRGGDFKSVGDIVGKSAYLMGSLTYAWQVKANKYATKLNIDLGNYEDRWYKAFKEAENRGKGGNLEKAYSYLIDYPKQLPSKDKILMFFNIYENGLQDLR